MSGFGNFNFGFIKNEQNFAKGGQSFKSQIKLFISNKTQDILLKAQFEDHNAICNFVTLRPDFDLEDKYKVAVYYHRIPNYHQRICV